MNDILNRVITMYKPDGLGKFYNTIFSGRNGDITDIVTNNSLERPESASLKQATDILVKAVYGSILQNHTDENGQNGKQHSMTALDQEYMDAVRQGDMAAAARMVEEAAKQARYDQTGATGMAAGHP